jgi:hypothetical protein
MVQDIMFTGNPNISDSLSQRKVQNQKLALSRQVTFHSTVCVFAISFALVFNSISIYVGDCWKNSLITSVGG